MEEVEDNNRNKGEDDNEGEDENEDEDEEGKVRDKTEEDENKALLQTFGKASNTAKRQGLAPETQREGLSRPMESSTYYKDKVREEPFRTVGHYYVPQGRVPRSLNTTSRELARVPKPERRYDPEQVSAAISTLLRESGTNYQPGQS